jgi:hypothetical protein
LQVVFAIALVIVLLLIVAVNSGSAALITTGFERAKGAGFGSLLGILATLVAARSVKKSSQAVVTNPYMGMFPLYAGLVFKLLIVAGGTWFGLVYLELGPIYVVLGYITMQAGYMWVAARPIC